MCGTRAPCCATTGTSPAAASSSACSDFWTKAVPPRATSASWSRWARVLRSKPHSSNSAGPSMPNSDQTHGQTSIPGGGSMSETTSQTPARSSPHTGTVLPQGRPFWIVDGRAYDFTEWMKLHPGGAMWFRQTEGRDISALLHTYHREPGRAEKFLARYEIKELAGQNVIPKVIVPPRAGEIVPPPPDAPPPMAGVEILPKLGIPPFL